MLTGVDNLGGQPSLPAVVNTERVGVNPVSFDVCLLQDVKHLTPPASDIEHWTEIADRLQIGQVTPHTVTNFGFGSPKRVSQGNVEGVEIGLRRLGQRSRGSRR
jgi:hypothetical protein